METTPVVTALCVSATVEQTHNEGKVMEATTTGKFMMPNGDKVYDTFIEMLRDQPQPPDPVFEEGDVLPTIEEAGFPLDKMEEHDKNFHLIVEDMIQALPYERKIMDGTVDMRALEEERKVLLHTAISLTDPKEKWEAVNRQNELSETKTEESNGGSLVVIPVGEQTVNTSPATCSALCSDVSETTASVVLPTFEEGGPICVGAVV